MLEVHVIETSLRGFPSELRAVADSLADEPTTSEVLSGSISTRVTGPGLTITRVNTVLPPTIAPTSTSPGLKKETVPDSSTPARSNGAANHADAGAVVLFPAASLTVAANFTFWPTEISWVAGAISKTLAEAGSWAMEFAVSIVIRTAKHKTASKLRRLGIMILLDELFSERMKWIATQQTR
jgi:hypothetical protein